MNTRIIALAVAVGVIVAGCAQAVPAPPTSTTPPPTTTTTSARALSDWPSETAYLLDVADSADAAALILTNAAYGSELYVAGLATDAELADLYESARAAMASHYNYFTGTRPPPGFEAVHGLFLHALASFVEAYELARDSVATHDLELLAEATALMDEAGGALEVAGAIMELKQ